jgi:hypothetical protein
MSLVFVFNQTLKDTAVPEAGEPAKMFGIMHYKDLISDKCLDYDTGKLVKEPLKQNTLGHFVLHAEKAWKKYAWQLQEQKQPRTEEAYKEWQAKREEDKRMHETKWKTLERVCYARWDNNSPAPPKPKWSAAMLHTSWPRMMRSHAIRHYSRMTLCACSVCVFLGVLCRVVRITRIMASCHHHF